MASQTLSRFTTDAPVSILKNHQIQAFTPLAATRILYSLVLIEDVAHLYTHRGLFLATGAWPHFPMGIACIMWLAALVLLLTGSRIGVWANWICAAGILGVVAPNEGFQQAACDSVMIGVAFLLLILPKLQPTMQRWVIAAYLSVIYLDSGIHKLLSPMWTAGYGALTPMGLPSLVWVPLNWMADVPAPLWRTLGWSVLGFELIFGLLYLIPQTRRPALIAGVLMHLSIAIIYPIPAFGFTMLALYAGLLLPWHSRQSTGQIAFAPRTCAIAATAYIACVASVYAPQWLPIRALHKAAWLSAGIASHEVFADDGFVHYHRQWRLVGPDGRVAPYSRGNLFSFDVRDRVWELWWKRTQAPFASAPDAHLAAWARYYWPGATVRIEAREQRVAIRAAEFALFRENNSVAWRPAGEVREGRVQWR